MENSSVRVLVPIAAAILAIVLFHGKATPVAALVVAALFVLCVYFLSGFVRELRRRLGAPDDSD